MAMTGAMDPLAIAGLPELDEATRLAQLPVVGLALEATGPDPREHWIKVVGIASASRPVAELACEVTGAPDGVPGYLAIAVIEKAISGKVIISHNAGFTLSFLLRSSIVQVPATIDTSCVGRHLFPGQPMHLDHLCKLFGMKLPVDTPRAAAWAAVSCWRRCVDVLEQSGITTWGELLAARVPLTPRQPLVPWPELAYQFRKRPAPAAASESEPDPLAAFA